MLLTHSHRRLALGLLCCVVASPARASDGSVVVPLAAAAAWPLLVFALLDLLLYAVDRHRRHSLWLGLTVLSAGALSLADALGTEGLMPRAAAVLLPLPFAAGIDYFWRFAGLRPSVWLRRYQRGLLAIAAVSAVLPAAWLEASAPVRWLSLAPFFVALAGLFWQILRRGDGEAMLPFAVGAALVVVAWASEVILRSLELGSARPLPALAWGGFWIGTLFLRIRRHRGAQDELGDLRVHLDSMVEDRTGELEEKNRQLEDELAERRLADEAMRMLEAAVEQSMDGIAVTDLNGGLQFINEAWAAMHGYEVFELLGYDLEIFHTPEQLREQVQPLLERLAADGAQQAEVEHRRRGGAVFPTWQTASLLHDPEGEAIGYVFIVRDMTERRRASEERQRLESKVREAEKLESLGRLAERIANDYNNMLTGILVNAGLALQEVGGDTDVAQRLQRIETSAERGADISGELMAYAGQEQAGELLTLGELFRQHRSDLEALVSGATLELHLKKSLPRVRGNSDQIVQALSNLVSNAADSLGEDGGLVMVRTSLVNAKPGYFDGAVLEPEGGPGRYVFFEVSDTGAGMDAETRQRVFEPYFTTKRQGRGMGLAAVLGIVRAHHGGIRVFSQLGRGTTVEILLPVEETATVLPDDPALSNWEGFGTALVVDDEQLVREVAAKVLQRRGFEVLTAGNGREGIDIFADRAYDIRLVLLDFEMPEMGGEAFVHAIRRFDSKARILLMSGYSERNATQGFGGELAGFLNKPFRPQELLRKVREVLDRR
ncbi:MAG: response regulator [Acidobacteriota bacterium]